FHVDALDRPDEAMDFCFRLAHTLGFRGYWVRRATAEGTEIELLRQLAGARALSRDPYREPALLPLPGGAVATALPALPDQGAEAVYSLHGPPPPPFEPKRLDS